MSRFEADSPTNGTAVRSSDAPWHGAPPGAGLAGVLESVTAAEDGLADLGDFDLVELVAAAQRMESWAHHVAASAAGELAGRESMEPTATAVLLSSLTSDRVAGEEVSLRLGWSARAGQRLVQEGQGYAQHLAATGDALRAGVIDVGKARAIVDGLRDVPAALALGVQEIVLPRAPQRTPAQLSKDVRGAIVDLDPTEAAARRERAVSSRHVTKPKAFADGMAGLWLRTSAADALAVFEAVDAGARTARRSGDPRSLDQLRADLLVERALHEARCAPGTNRPRAGSCRSAVRVDLRVLVPLSTLIGTEDEPGYLDDYGIIDPELARALARGGTWRRLVTDPASGTVLDVGRTRYTPPADLAEHVRFRAGSCARPGCEASAWRCELDHTEPFHTKPFHLDPARGGPTAARNLAPLSKGCHQVKTHAGFELDQPWQGRYRWTTPTGHVYEHEAAPWLRGAGNTNQIHVIRQNLIELDATGPPREPPEPITSPEPQDLGPPPF